MIERGLRYQHGYQAIDIARFLFSLLIVAFHFPPFYGSRGLAGIADFLLLRYLERLAVPYFFICSGFFLYRGIVWKSKDSRREKNYFLRIVRLYVIWTIIYLPYSIYTFQYDEAGMIHALVIYLRDFIFTGACFHLWYLNALAFAVLLIAILRKLGLEPRAILIVSGLFFLSGLLAQSWFGLIRPLKAFSPAVWHGLKRIGNLIVTTRNGLFEGFFYVAAGMYIAVNRSQKRQRLVAVGFALSMGGLLAEILILRRLGWSRATDIYLFQAPAVIFLFLLLSGIQKQEGRDYRQLRKISGLVYYVHPLTGFLIEVITERLDSDLTHNAPVFFGLVLILSLSFAVMILRLSDSRRYSLLKWIYE